MGENGGSGNNGIKNYKFKFFNPPQIENNVILVKGKRIRVYFSDSPSRKGKIISELKGEGLERYAEVKIKRSGKIIRLHI